MRIFLAAFAAVTIIHAAQVVDLYTPKDLLTIKQQLAKDNTRFASRELVKYGNHYTMLAYRETTGSSEIHEHEADVFFIQDGEAVLLTGGKMLGGHLQKPGELRGTSIAGGEKHSLKAGDIVHIPAGVPHQLLVTPGKPITYFVVKVSGQ